MHSFLSLHPHFPRSRPPLSGTEEGKVPRCRRRCSPVGSDPFLGAGQNPARKGVVEGVRERASGFLSFDKK